MAKLTTESFIERSRAVHGDWYDYSEVTYKNTKAKVRIRCPEHGIFLQAPEKHMVGQGCPRCRERKTEETNLRKYGVKRPLMSSEIRDTMYARNEANYGTRHSGSRPDVIEKRKETVRRKYGVDYACQALSVREKIQATCRERYHGNSPFADPLVRQKARETMGKRFGVSNAMLSGKGLASYKQSCMDRYGVEFPFQSPDVRERIQSTSRLRYGSDGPLSDGTVRNKGIRTMQPSYGVLNPMHSDGFKQMVRETKRKNHTSHTSGPEGKLYCLLCNRFGEADVFRQHVSDWYPFACDFYIPSRDLYIELNASWTHGGCWYDEDNAMHRDLVQNWAGIGTDYYRNAVHVWTESDARKRETARKNGLNYLVFWQNDLSDVGDWMAAGCPDGRDYELEYSWR